MPVLARFSTIFVVGLGLTAATSALGQRDKNQAAKGVVNVGLSDRAAATTASPGRQAVSGADEPPTASFPEAGHKSGGGGGYSWTDKGGRPKKHKKATTIDPSRPLAQAPSFAMRADGSSVVTLALSQTTQVTRVIDAGRVEYRLRDAQIGVSNNMNPLVTAHFSTPVERVVMRRLKDGVALSLELREQVRPLHQIRNGPAGGAVLEITLPKPSRTYAVPKTQQVSQPSAVVREESEPERTAKHRKGKRPGAQSGPGSRL
jgi:hypothetical protein